MKTKKIYRSTVVVGRVGIRSKPYLRSGDRSSASRSLAPSVRYIQTLCLYRQTDLKGRLVSIMIARVIRIQNSKRGLASYLSTSNKGSV
jgi:hypothetical protein